MYCIPVYHYRPLYSRRRCSVGVLQTLRHSTSLPESSTPTVAKEMGDEVMGNELCTDTAEAIYKNKCIAKELSDMVYYTEPIKFNGFKVKFFIGKYFSSINYCLIDCREGEGQI